ncbi:MAG: hypothetical protein N2Z22_12330, partial [Turneriella sp.]|nr:hypothetical protein [Turneriella sp.]
MQRNCGGCFGVTWQWKNPAREIRLSIKRLHPKRYVSHSIHGKTQRRQAISRYFAILMVPILTLLVACNHYGLVD